jgi:hypothetical protein
MVDLQTLTTMFGGIGVGVAAIYYMLTIRNSEKIRRKDFLFQAQLARTPEYYKMFSQVTKMHDYETEEEWNSKYDEEQRLQWNYLAQHFNVIGLMFMDGVVPTDTLFRMYPTYAVIRLWEQSEKHIVEISKVTNENPFSGLEALYREAKKRNPDYIPSWKRAKMKTSQ